MESPSAPVRLAVATKQKIIKRDCCSRHTRVTSFIFSDLGRGLHWRDDCTCHLGRSEKKRRVTYTKNKNVFTMHELTKKVGCDTVAVGRHISGQQS